MLKYASFKLTNNSKVRFFDGHNNTFSTRQGKPEDGGTCPCATAGDGGCLKVCYASNLRKLYKAYASVEDYNTELIKGQSIEDMHTIIRNTVLKWLLTEGHKKPYFRLHTSGDFFSEDYAKAWSMVIEEFSDSVRFWTYTRSLFAVPILAKHKNLTLMLSCDPVNHKEVTEFYQDYKDYPNIAIAWMGNDCPLDEVADRQLLVCPEVTGKMKNTKQAGACSRCRACIDRPLKNGKIRHIQFPIHRWLYLLDLCHQRN